MDDKDNELIKVKKQLMKENLIKMTDELVQYKQN